MALELKHLVPYLPFRLNGFCNLFQDDCDELIGIYSYNDVLLKKTGDCCLKFFKPILRPISDLDKEISFGMLKAIPLDNINFLYQNIPNFYFLTTDKSQEHLFNGKHDLSNTIIEYCVMQKLIEWHFDVFGLIDKGLAISIHDVGQVIA